MKKDELKFYIGREVKVILENGQKYYGVLFFDEANSNNVVLQGVENNTLKKDDIKEVYYLKS